MDYHVYHKIEEIVNPALKSNRLRNLLQYCEENQVLFVDREFPPNQNSLIGNPVPSDYTGQLQVVEWKRASALFGDDAYDIFKGITPCDIIQGSLGNCYLLCALSSLAEHPQLISRLFDFNEANDYGVHGVWLNINGVWTRYILDEYFPSYFNGIEHDLAFSKTEQNELWVILLEKAYAKAYGSYWETVGGDPVHALRDLSGAPYDRVEDFSNLEAAWQKMYDANVKHYILTCFTKSSDISEEKMCTGLVTGHAYSILDVREIINAKGEPARVIKIRNPWGKFEWNGDYSDNSPLWTPEQRQELDIKIADDGLFWMKLEDFIQYFQGVGILEIIPGYLSNAVLVENQDLAIVRMQVSESSYITIGIDQIDTRIINDPDYSYSYFRVTIGKLNGKQGIQFVDSILSPERNIFLDNKYGPGEYIILIEPYWSTDVVRRFNVSTYSDNEVELELLHLCGKSYDQSEYHIWKDFARRNIQKMKQKGSRVAGYGHQTAALESYQHQDQQYASVLYAYFNKSNENAVHQSLDFKTLKGFVPVGHDANKQGAELIINPQNVDVILFKMDPRSQGFSLAKQITGEEVIPYSFSEDLTSLELINSLGGLQPTPEDAHPAMRSKQNRNDEIQRAKRERQQLLAQLRREKEEMERQVELKRKKLMEEKRRAEEERARQMANRQKYNGGGYGGYFGQNQGFFSHLSQNYGGGQDSVYRNNRYDLNKYINMWTGGHNTQPNYGYSDSNQNDNNCVIF